MYTALPRDAGPVHRARAAWVFTTVAATALYLAVSGVGPVLVGDLELVVVGCAAASVGSCLLRPGGARVGLVWLAGAYPHFLSVCSDTLASAGSHGGSLVCPLGPGSGLSVLLVGVPGSMLLSGLLAPASYVLGRGLYERYVGTGPLQMM